MRLCSDNVRVRMRHVSNPHPVLQGVLDTGLLCVPTPEDTVEALRFDCSRALDGLISFASARAAGNKALCEMLTQPVAGVRNLNVHLTFSLARSFRFSKSAMCSCRTCCTEFSYRYIILLFVNDAPTTVTSDFHLRSNASGLRHILVIIPSVRFKKPTSDSVCVDLPTSQ